jgi:hypothetical protein
MYSQSRGTALGIPRGMAARLVGKTAERRIEGQLLRHTGMPQTSGKIQNGRPDCSGRPFEQTVKRFTEAERSRPAGP